MSRLAKAIVLFVSLVGMGVWSGEALATLEKKYVIQFKAVFDAIRELMTPLEPRKKRSLGFIANIEGDGK